MVVAGTALGLRVHGAKMVKVIGKAGLMMDGIVTQALGKVEKDMMLGVRMVKIVGMVVLITGGGFTMAKEKVVGTAVMVTAGKGTMVMQVPKEKIMAAKVHLLMLRDSRAKARTTMC